MLLMLIQLPISSLNPHGPLTLTWEITSQLGAPIWSISNNVSLWAWWPNLYPDLCRLVSGLDAWDILDEQNIACRDPMAKHRLKTDPFYICPKDGRTRAIVRKCGGFDHYFCKSWGCETTGVAPWKPTSSWDLISVTRGNATTLNVTFTNKGKVSRDWLKGRTWGFRFYITGTDPGFTFTVRLRADPLRTVPIGPNQILSNQSRGPSPNDSHGLTADLLPRRHPFLNSSLKTYHPEQRLFSIVQGAYTALNHTSSNLTQACWLCLSSIPPYYQGIVHSGNYTVSGGDDRCNWGKPGKLTLTEIFGQGLCIGNPTPEYQPLCSETHVISGANITKNTTIIHENVTSKYLVPLGGWWACNTGLTPCLHTSIFNQSADFCIMIQLLPKVTYYETAPFEDRFDSYRQGGSLIGDRHKRELISISLAVLLGLGIAAGIGTGAAALVQGSQSYQELRMSIDEDLKVLEQSITHLEKSLTSLSEVVLQNRRGLDLLFLQQGGVCVALNEECCFYSDHSGVIKDSMTKLRQRLVERRKEREASQGWFQGWFNKTPWLTTLISVLSGPLLIILLLLTLGPCVLNRLIQFVRSQVSTVQLFMLRHEYQELNPSEDPTIP